MYNKFLVILMSILGTKFDNIHNLFTTLMAEIYNNAHPTRSIEFHKNCYQFIAQGHTEITVDLVVDNVFIRIHNLREHTYTIYKLEEQTDKQGYYSLRFVGRD